MLPRQRPTVCIEELANTKDYEVEFQLYARNLDSLGMSQIDAARTASELEEILPDDLAGQPPFPAVHKALWEIMWEKNWRLAP